MKKIYFINEERATKEKQWQENKVTYMQKSIIHSKSWKEGTLIQLAELVNRQEGGKLKARCQGVIEKINRNYGEFQVRISNLYGQMMIKCASLIIRENQIIWMSPYSNDFYWFNDDFLQTNFINKLKIT